jgi:hypothetical protein
LANSRTFTLDGIILAMTISLKDAQGAQGMRVAGKLASEVLDFITPAAAAAAADAIASAAATPSG